MREGRHCLGRERDLVHHGRLGFGTRAMRGGCGYIHIHTLSSRRVGRKQAEGFVVNALGGAMVSIHS